MLKNRMVPPDVAKLAFKELNAIIACPNCKSPLALHVSREVECIHCGESYRRHAYTWELIPSSWRKSSDLWPVWEQLQANGLVSYAQDPEHNISVGQRPDCLDFARFCQFDGLVLDVGCGPQTWPAYFAFYSERTRFIGVDPLAGDSPANYVQFRALGEYLPFRDLVFDHVVFATSLDHFIDPLPALVEARRVCHPGGQIDIWIGEKRADTPKLTESPEWYTRLKKPDEAMDVFHLKRLEIFDLKVLISQANLSVIVREVHQVDGYRTNYFYKLGLTP